MKRIKILRSVCDLLCLFLLISVCVQHALSSGRARGPVTKVCAVNSRHYQGLLQDITSLLHIEEEVMLIKCYSTVVFFVFIKLEKAYKSKV